MDYTCENCKSRHTWDCDDGGVQISSLTKAL